MDIDWLDVPEKAQNNAFIIDLGPHGKAYNKYLDSIVKSGDIVIFGPKQTVIRYVPKNYRDAIGKIIPDINDGSLTIDKLDEETRNLILGAIQEIISEDTSTVKLNGTGKECDPLTAEVQLSERTTNAIADKDGLFVNNAELSFEPLTKRLTFTDTKGETYDVDLTSLTEEDFYVTGAELDHNNNLIIKREGLSDIYVDLSQLEEIDTMNSNTITLKGNGTKADKLLQEVKVSNTRDNMLEETVRGLKVTKDLSQYDNSVQKFAKESDIKDADIRVKGIHGIKVDETFSTNQSTDKTIIIELDQDTKDRITRGKQAYEFGDHREAGYVTESNLDSTLESFAKKTDVKDAKISFRGLGGIEVDNSFTTNQGDNQCIDIELDQSTQNKITRGKQAYDWGNHQDAGYVTEDTKYTGSEGIRIQGTDVQVHIDNNPNNILQIEDGLFQGNASIYFKNSTNELVFTDNKGEETKLNLSALTTDLHINGATLSGNQLTLVVDGGNTVNVDLDDLTKSSTQETNTIEFFGTGQQTDKLSAKVKLNSADNAIVETVQGLKVTKDLSQFDNTVSKFAKESDIGNGTLTVSGKNGIEGTGSFNQNSSTNKDIELELTDKIKSDIQEGKDAFAWGDHSQAGYVSVDTTYEGKNGITVRGTDIEVQIDNNPENILSIEDGLFQKNSKLYFKNSSNELVFTDNQGLESSIDLSGLTADLHINDATLDGTILTLDVQGQTPVQVDLKTLTRVGSTDSNTIEFLGLGTSDNKLTQNVRLNSQDNAIEETPSGLQVSKDLSKFDNTISGFAKSTEIGTGELTLEGIHGIQAQGTFGANASADKIVHIGLGSGTRADIQKGVDAFNFGDHRTEGYVTTDTTYTQGENLELVGTEFDVKLNSVHTDNQIIKDGGLYVKNTELNYNPASKELTFVNNKGQSNVLNLAQLATDIHVNGGEVQGDNLILTFENGGNPLSVNLSSLSKITDITNTNSIEISGDGSYGNALTQKVNISQGSDNVLEEKADGLSVTSDLSKFDNSISNFAKRDEIGDAKLQLLGDDDVEVNFDNSGTDSFKQNARTDEVVHFKLSANIKGSIAQGAEAYSWGNHQDAGYALKSEITEANYVKDSELHSKVIEILESIDWIGSPNIEDLG